MFAFILAGNYLNFIAFFHMQPVHVAVGCEQASLVAEQYHIAEALQIARIDDGAIFRRAHGRVRGRVNIDAVIMQPAFLGTVGGYDLAAHRPDQFSG